VTDEKYWYLRRVRWDMLLPAVVVREEGNCGMRDVVRLAQVQLGLESLLHQSLKPPLRNHDVRGQHHLHKPVSECYLSRTEDRQEKIAWQMTDQGNRRRSVLI
jgi:hypothetical protein